MIGNGSVSKRADRAHRRHAGPRAAGQEGHSGREDCDRTGPSTADGKSRWRICLRRRLPNGQSAALTHENGEGCPSTDSTGRRSECRIHPRIVLPLVDPMQAHYAARAAIRRCEPWGRYGAAITRDVGLSLRRLRDGRDDLGARCLERSAGGLTRDRGPQLPWSRTSSFTSRAAAIATGCRGRRRERATRSSKS